MDRSTEDATNPLLAGGLAKRQGAFKRVLHRLLRRAPSDSGELRNFYVLRASLQVFRDLPDTPIDLRAALVDALYILEGYANDLIRVRERALNVVRLTVGDGHVEFSDNHKEMLMEWWDRGLALSTMSTELAVHDLFALDHRSGLFTDKCWMRDVQRFPSVTVQTFNYGPYRVPSIIILSGIREQDRFDLTAEQLAFFDRALATLVQP